MSKTFKPYDFTLAAGGSQVILAEGEYFRVQSATGALDVTVEGFGTMPGLLSGQALKETPFKRLVLRDASGAANSGIILVASQEFVDNRLYGVVTLGSAVALDAATLAALHQPDLSTGSFNSTAAFAANTAIEVFSPAANLNGAIVLSAGGLDNLTSPAPFVLTAKNVAPTGWTQGEVIASSVFAPEAGYQISNMRLDQSVKLAAGLGLYFISGYASAGTIVSFRHCRYKLL